MKEILLIIAVIMFFGGMIFIMKDINKHSN